MGNEKARVNMSEREKERKVRMSIVIREILRARVSDSC